LALHPWAWDEAKFDPTSLPILIPFGVADITLLNGLVNINSTN
jgi:hypothetical protein